MIDWEKIFKIPLYLRTSTGIYKEPKEKQTTNTSIIKTIQYFTKEDVQMAITST